jgi:formyltetrahydrofolate hydrolase
VSLVSAHLAEQGGNNLRAEQSESAADSRFYQRIHFNLSDNSLDLEAFSAGFAPIAQKLQAEWSLHAMDATNSRTTWRWSSWSSLATCRSSPEGSSSAGRGG